MSNRNPFLGDLVRPLSQLLTRLLVFSAGTRAERLATTRFMLFHHQRIFPLKNLSAFMRRLIAAHLSSPTVSLQNRRRNLSDLNLGLMTGSVFIPLWLAW